MPVARVLVSWPDMPIVVTLPKAPEDSVTVPHAAVPAVPLFLSIWLEEPAAGKWIFPAVVA